MSVTSLICLVAELFLSSNSYMLPLCPFRPLSFRAWARIFYPSWEIGYLLLHMGQEIKRAHTHSKFYYANSCRFLIQWVISRGGQSIFIGKIPLFIYFRALWAQIEWGTGLETGFRVRIFLSLPPPMAAPGNIPFVSVIHMCYWPLFNLFVLLLLNIYHIHLQY